MLAKCLGFLDARNVLSGTTLGCAWVCVCQPPVSFLDSWGRKAKVWREAWCRFQETQKATLELDVVTYSTTISATAGKWQHANGLVQDLKGSLFIDRFPKMENVSFLKVTFIVFWRMIFFEGYSSWGFSTFGYFWHFKEYEQQKVCLDAMDWYGRPQGRGGGRQVWQWNSQLRRWTQGWRHHLHCRSGCLRKGIRMATWASRPSGSWWFSSGDRFGDAEFGHLHMCFRETCNVFNVKATVMTMREDFMNRIPFPDGMTWVTITL